MITALFLLMFQLASFGGNPKTVTLRPTHHFSTKVPEPSDICMATNGAHYWVVSDNGIVVAIDWEGKEIRRASLHGYDFEGVWADSGKVYVVDEMTRRIHVLDEATLALIQTQIIPHQGARNKGMEAVTRNPVSGRLLVAMEKAPTQILELDETYRAINHVEINGLKDISAMTSWNGRLFLLSDEDMLVVELNPSDYSILERWRIPVINPEGLCFSPDGTLTVTSDDMGRIFQFKLP